MVGTRVSETQLISSRNKIPSFRPDFAMWSYTEATISLIVYSVTEYSLPPNSFLEMNGSPIALCLV